MHSDVRSNTVKLTYSPSTVTALMKVASMDSDTGRIFICRLPNSSSWSVFLTAVVSVVHSDCGRDDQHQGEDYVVDRSETRRKKMQTLELLPTKSHRAFSFKLTAIYVFPPLFAISNIFRETKLGIGNS